MKQLKQYRNNFWSHENIQKECHCDAGVSPMRRSMTLGNSASIILIIFSLFFISSKVSAQSPLDSLSKKDTVIKKTDIVKHDTVFKHEDIAFQGKDTVIHRRDSIYRRALAVFDASSITVSNEAVRAYTSPMTFSALLEETNGAYPLIQTNQGYGREAFEFTNRTSEPIAASFLEGVLPLNDPLTGNTDLNFFPLEIASSTSIQNGGMLSGADHGSSDAINFTLERFRAPIPYSRFHYTQELADALSNFEGLFSINSSEPLNLALGVYHRSAGTIANVGDFTFDPRLEQWWVRGQATYDTKSVNGLLFMLYRSAFNGINGGIIARDSTTDIFDQQLSTVKDPSPFDHRTRFDVLAQLGFSLFSEKERTVLSAYGTTSARRMLGVDSTFPQYASTLLQAQRYGISLLQPATLQIGEFITRASLRGDMQYLTRYSPATDSSSVSETRFSALGSDSLSLSGLFGISVSGYLRETLSKLSVIGVAQPEILLTNFGLEASAKLTEALKFTAQINYAKDRASLSPSPTSTYELRNIGAFLNMNVKFGIRERLALSLGYLDRHEPEGVFLQAISGDSVFKPMFSSADIHTGSIRGNLDLWFSYFRYSLQTTFFPATVPLSQYTTNSALLSDLKQRIQSTMGLYYENEIAEGNLRMSFGTRIRYMSSLSPSLTYDPFSDYYVYRGLDARGQQTLNDSRLTSPKYIWDILVSTVIDQRATVNFSFLNILSTPYYNVGIYPRGGFQFRLDVTWAFLD